jgi:hypothetical protein
MEQFYDRYLDMVTPVFTGGIKHVFPALSVLISQCPILYHMDQGWPMPHIKAALFPSSR